MNSVNFIQSYKPGKYRINTPLIYLSHEIPSHNNEDGSNEDVSENTESENESEDEEYNTSESVVYGDDDDNENIDRYIEISAYNLKSKHSFRFISCKFSTSTMTYCVIVFILYLHIIFR